MSKRNTISAFTLSTAAVAMLCIFSSVVAQKGSEGTASATKPVRGIDVIVQKNPGNSASRITGTSDSDGKIGLGVLAPGSYSLEILPPSKEKMTALGDGGEYLLVEVTGPSVVGGAQRMAWEVKTHKFVLPSPSGTARTTTAPAYTEKVQFEVTGSPQPVQIKIKKGRSNAVNN